MAMTFLPTGEITAEGIEKRRKKLRAARKKREGLTNGRTKRNKQSRSVGCHPSQVEEKNAELKRRGVTTHFYNKRGYLTADGEQSNRSQRRALKRIGLVNLDDNS